MAINIQRENECGLVQLQNWLHADTIPEAGAQKIFGAADRILKAGRE